MSKNYKTAQQIIDHIKLFQREKDIPIVVAIDGASGAGKSTFAAAIAPELKATIIPIDDFFAGHIPENDWAKFSTKEKINKVWKREYLRDVVIKPLRAGKTVKWQSLDFERGIQSDGTYKVKSDYSVRKHAKIILLEGAYSFSPQLEDLVDISILIDVDIKKRHTRLSLREQKDFLEKRHQLWDLAEKYYFTKIRPKNSYDIVMKLD